jgi:hypothetical protein
MALFHARRLAMREEFRKFIDTETKIIEISKWLAGEKLKRDPGDEYISKWIDDHAEELRDAWNKSKCKSCGRDCLHQLRIFCEEYFPEE